MKKEALTKEDKIILKKQGFSFFYFLIMFFCLQLWGYYIYYFKESYFDNYGRSYLLGLFVLVLIGIVGTGIFISSKTEFYSGYKLVFIGNITSKEIIDNNGISYHFFMKEEEFTVSKDDYEKYKRGQKVRIEVSSVLKQTIRVSAIN
ncbi:hypothetical protein Fleli_0314 [Bernardetia litoralis DSM 6794]|uniref:Uncharacterized protein n=1 Tax=Bernardetia litoralis (strain ATCC 23117 / DSM 6794 / NBRC 15988 / NCIMB 1366 / Fx l1 / Sio-4) TaxID=880071 RepID=I4AFR6_BERLS|nr:hypothetical protein [Bernardetia litoralis]AFM02801.1 hypothetical protein Fleli_0314 [Bernardetia litoralis DSM 6794]